MSIWAPRDSRPLATLFSCIRARAPLGCSAVRSLVASTSVDQRLLCRRTLRVDTQEGSGHPSPIPPSLAEEFRQWVIDGPAEQGMDRANWTHEELADHLLKAKGIRSSRSAVQRFCSKIGIRLYRPTYRTEREQMRQRQRVHVRGGTTRQQDIVWQTDPEAVKISFLSPPNASLSACVSFLLPGRVSCCTCLWVPKGIHRAVNYRAGSCSTSADSACSGWACPVPCERVIRQYPRVPANRGRRRPGPRSPASSS